MSYVRRSDYQRKARRIMTNRCRFFSHVHFISFMSGLCFSLGTLNLFFSFVSPPPSSRAHPRLSATAPPGAEVHLFFRAAKWLASITQVSSRRRREASNGAAHAARDGVSADGPCSCSFNASAVLCRAHIRGKAHSGCAPGPGSVCLAR